MASRIVDFKIDNRTYQLTKMPPNGGHRFATKVAHLLGLSLAGEASSLFAMAKEVGIEAGADAAKALAVKGMDGKILALVMRLIPHIDPNKLGDLMDEVFDNCKVMVRVGDGPSLSLARDKDFDEHFGSDESAGDFYPVAFWAIKENAGSFFVQSGPGFRTLVRHLPVSASPTTDTGTTSSAALRRPASAA